MWRINDNGETERQRMAGLAVLAAAAKEAEELLAQTAEELEPEVIQEADRRLRRFSERVGRPA